MHSTYLALKAPLLGSALADTVNRLEALAGSFYFYEPRSRLRSSSSLGSEIVWENDSPNEAESLSYGELDTYALSLCSSLTGSYSLSPLEAIAKISERKLWGSVSLLFIPFHTESGDYGGATYHLSNAQALLEAYGSSPGCCEVIGGHGSYALALDPRYVSADLLEALEALESYPIFDEDHLSQLEEELKAEAFDSWLASDLRRLISSSLPSELEALGLSEEEAEERADLLAENASEEMLWALLTAADSDGCLWEAEHNSIYCDLSRLSSELIAEVLL